MVDQRLDFTSKERAPWLSFEVFPPKTADGVTRLSAELAAMARAQPDFVSVTYGAGGSTRRTSLNVLREVSRHGMTPVAHLTCVGMTRSHVRALVGEFLDAGIRNFLALRGDPPKGVAAEDWRPGPRGVAFAQQLIGLLFEVAGARGIGREQIAVGVAAFPGGHHQSSSLAQDVAVLAEKERVGATFALSQLFFDPVEYVVLSEKARAAGIGMPIIPGVMPMTSPQRLQRMMALTSKPYPAGLLSGLAGREGEERYRFGMDATEALARRLLEFGAPGIHVYTLNQSAPAIDLITRLGLREAG